MTLSPPSASPERPGAAAIVLMSLVVLWSGALALGFAFAATSLTGTTALLFFLIAAFLSVLALRTAYELVHRFVLGRRG